MEVGKYQQVFGQHLSSTSSLAVGVSDDKTDTENGISLHQIIQNGQSGEAKK